MESAEAAADENRQPGRSTAVIAVDGGFRGFSKGFISAGFLGPSKCFITPHCSDTVTDCRRMSPENMNAGLCYFMWISMFHNHLNL